MEALIRRLQDMVRECDNIVFFGGAGVSTASGIPDFRSEHGLYRQKYPYPPETMLSRSFFDEHTGAFFDFYRDKILHLDARPNSAHEKLAELEAAGKLRAVITQNIDGLHQRAGSRRVLELHGSVLRNRCMDCEKSHEVEFVAASTGVPRCSCGGVVKPDVVLYEEGLDDGVVQEAVEAISRAQMLIVGGTSLVVYPAAGFLRYFSGGYLVMINKSPTAMDGSADLVLAGDIAEIMGKINV